MNSSKLLIRGMLLAASFGLLAACDGLPGAIGAANVVNKAAEQCAALDGGTVPGAGSADSHGMPQRDEGMVQTQPDGSGFSASRTVSIANDFGGAGAAQVALTTGNGNVQSCVVDGGGYRIVVMLEGHGPTAEAARAALDAIKVKHADMLDNGTLALNTQVEFGGQNDTSVQSRATIVAGLPRAASYTFDHNSNNGNVAAQGFSGDSAKLNTGNGNVMLDGGWGQVMLTGSNGNVAAMLDTARSLSATGTTGNGMVDVQLRRTGTPGYDLSASVGNGTARIDVAGTDPVGEQSMTSAHRRSADYDSNPIKVNVAASSGNGNAMIHE